MSIFPKPLKDLESDCATVTEKVFALESRLSTKAEELYLELIDLTIKTPKMTTQEMVILALSIKTFRILQCIKGPLISGYYEVAENLIRSIIEHANLVELLQIRR
jgi:hypothetical protein